MSILSGFLKTKRRRLTDEGYILQSEWTSASTVEFDDGMNAEEKIQEIKGKKITLADYLALPEEEQKTGAYWIEDANEPLGDGSRFLKTTDVVDSFDSSDSKLPLSAKKGKEIKEELNNLTPQKLNGACVFSSNQVGYIVSSMIPLANADKKNISITNNVTILGDEPIDIGASRFFISSYGTGFILCTKDTVAIETCANKGVSFGFTVS